METPLQTRPLAGPASGRQSLEILLRQLQRPGGGCWKAVSLGAVPPRSPTGLPLIRQSRQ